MTHVPATRRIAGAASTEYILVVVLVGITLIGIVTTFGYRVMRLWKKDIIALDTGRPPVTAGPITLGNANPAGSFNVVPRNFPADGTITPDQAAFDAALDLLQYSPTGRAALEWLQQNNVTIQLTPGIHGHFNPPTGPIRLDPNSGPADLAMVLVHEAEHARADIGGTGPDINNPNKNAYVNGMLLEEATGSWLAIEAKMEMEAAGQTVNAQFPQNLEADYRTAYNNAVAALQAANPNATPADLDAAGRAAGRQRVLDRFNNGSVLVSFGPPPVTYPQYYGTAWDGHHGVGGGS